ncbi:50S ribosomal protein L25 [bacterium]|nr:MAG: 50S ribosomal protein L25 [bacterium]
MSVMPATNELPVQPRTDTGSGPARKIRRQGLVPGIVYGHGQTIPIAFSSKALHDALGGHSASGVLFTLTGLPGKSATARLRDVQIDPTKAHRLVHADFQLVTRGEAVRAEVPVITVGVAKAVKDAGAILEVALHSVLIEGPAGEIPEALEVDVTQLALGGHIFVGDLTLPKGLKAVTPADTLLVAVEASKIERTLAEEAAQAAPATPQPEVISRGKEGETA